MLRVMIFCPRGRPGSPPRLTLGAANLPSEYDMNRDPRKGKAPGQVPYGPAPST